MVFLTIRLLTAKVSKRYGGFIDSLRLTVRGGPGGMGQPKFGGIGGRGGDIVFVADEESTLQQVLRRNSTKLIKGAAGQNSQQFKLVGDSAKDTVIPVPTGIAVYTQSGIKLGELNSKGDCVTVARGGMGGQAVTQFNGQKGDEVAVVLDLKLIADVGLVGFPNAGKSSLLKAISRARPRVAEYPFTTLRPQLGTVEYEDGRQVTVADLPGLIEGAHRNLGLGHRFLKHVERTKVLLVVVDVNGFRLGPEYPHRDALQCVALLNKELELYGRGVGQQPCVLLINKADTAGAEKLWSQLQPALHHYQDSVRSMQEHMQPDTPLNFDKVLHMSVQQEPHRVLELAQILRELLDAQASADADSAEADAASIKISRALTEHRNTRLV